jgi:hypothetical protein
LIQAADETAVCLDKAEQKLDELATIPLTAQQEALVLDLYERHVAFEERCSGVDEDEEPDGEPPWEPLTLHGELPPVYRDLERMGMVVVADEADPDGACWLIEPTQIATRRGQIARSARIRGRAPRLSLAKLN